MGYDLYIVIGEKNDGKTFPRTESGLADARAASDENTVKIRPATKDKSYATSNSDDDDIDEYGVVINRGNCNAYIKP